MLGPLPLASPPPAPRRSHIVAVTGVDACGERASIAVNLACAMAELSRRTMILDADPQGAASAWAAEGQLPVSCMLHPLESLERMEPWLEAVGVLRARHDLVVVDLPLASAPALAISFLMASVIVIAVAPGFEPKAFARLRNQLERMRAERAASPPAVLVVPMRPDAAQLPEALQLAALGGQLTPSLHADPCWDQARERSSWIGALRRSGRAHGELDRLAGLVAERLADLPSSSWPMARPRKAAARPPVLPRPAALSDQAPAMPEAALVGDMWRSPGIAGWSTRVHQLLRVVRAA